MNAWFKVLGVRVDAIQIPDVVAWMEGCIARKECGHFISVANVHVVMEAQRDASFKGALDSADLVVPDGMPLIWLGRRQGFRLRHRVYGPDLLLAFCRETHAKGYTHFFYGGAPGVPEKLAGVMKNNFPLLQVAGAYSPPFRPLTQDEDTQIISIINQAAPDVLWVGLGCPKQERWMYEHRDRLAVPVILGVGQAFDIHSGRLRQAPLWMREHGLEWLFRLGQDPRRLWRRYLGCNAQFICRVLADVFASKQFH